MIIWLASSLVNFLSRAQYFNRRGSLFNYIWSNVKILVKVSMQVMPNTFCKHGSRYYLYFWNEQSMIFVKFPYMICQSARIFQCSLFHATRLIFRQPISGICMWPKTLEIIYSRKCRDTADGTTFMNWLSPWRSRLRLPVPYSRPFFLHRFFGVYIIIIIYYLRDYKPNT